MKVMVQSRQRSLPSSAFTLIEILVVLSLLLVLAAIALPNVKELVANQVVARTARNINAYFDVARTRAIAEGRRVGVLIERTGADERGRATSIRMRQLTSVPPYTGDASNSVAVLQIDGISANFDPANNQLLALSASMVRNPSVVGDVDDPRAPIRNGDYLELPGGRLVPFTITYRDLNQAANVPVVINFNLSEPRNGTALFPSANKTITTPRAVKFKIHRKPVVSTMAPFNLPRGVVIDLNYSGFGDSGNQFAPAPLQTPPTPTPAAFDIAIVFGPDGKVVSVTDPGSGALVPPIGQLFFCMGDSDGVRTDNLFAQEQGATANLLSLDSTWIVLNPSTGRVVTSPFAPVSTLPPPSPPAAPITDPTDPSLGPAIQEARLLANLSDTVELE